MEPSSTVRFLRGKRLPGLPGPIVNVTKKGEDQRVLTDARGNRLTISTTRLKSAFNRVLAAHQLRESLSTVRVLGNYKATVMLGGKTNGVKKTFSSKAAAIGAAHNFYDKAK